ncbi:hypothetical protein [Vibrio sonorensis]|uniref:hypothetical protein n=1 Tax=Vibrio sonorensis TaxID=1004316 RepID=UPI0008DAA967|nr:hypothetical protein [Vibrio sonorensis]
MLRETISATFRFIQAYKQPLFTAMLFPSLLVIILDLSFTEAENLGLYISVQLLTLLLTSLLTFSIHKAVLSDFRPTSFFSSLKFDKGFFWFFGHVLLIVLLFVVMIMSAFIATWMVVPAMFIGVYISARWSLVFPAIATGKAVSFGYSWKLTEPFQSYMIKVVLLFPLLLGLAIMPLAFIAPIWVVSIFGIFSSLLTTVALSVAYRFVLEHTPTQN